VGSKEPTEQEQENQRESHLPREDSVLGDMGRGDGVRVQNGTESDKERVECREGVDHTKSEVREAEFAGFAHDRIVAITSAPEEETFDLTIEGSHSFVADGIVVHNTIPKHSVWAHKLRTGYKAPPGFLVVNIDFSQGELRIAACIANEKNMLQAYRDGMDLHLITGGRVNGIELDDLLDMKEAAKKDKKIAKRLKKIRQGGKAGNFGLLYGMGAKGFMEYARVSYRVYLTLTEATNARDAFFELYPGLVTWHEQSKKFARQHGFVCSPLGRKRHLPLIYSSDNEMRSKAERQAINAQVQSTLSDVGQFALVKFHETYGRPDGCRPFMFCHDAIVFYVKEEDAGIWIPRAKDLMENLPLKETFGWDHQIPFPVDVEVGSSMATMEGGLW